MKSAVLRSIRTYLETAWTTPLQGSGLRRLHSKRYARRLPCTRFPPQLCSILYTTYSITTLCFFLHPSRRRRKKLGNGRRGVWCYWAKAFLPTSRRGSKNIRRSTNNNTTSYVQWSLLFYRPNCQVYWVWIFLDELRQSFDLFGWPHNLCSLNTSCWPLKTFIL